MLKKIIYRVFGSFVSLVMFSCQDDYISVSDTTVKNDKFIINHKVLPLRLQQRDIRKIQGDNITVPMQKYILGTYKNNPYKTINASIVSQLAFFDKISVKQKSINDVKKFKTKSNIDSVLTLDKVVLQIPVHSEQDNEYSLGKFVTASKKITIKVLENKTFLNLLNPKKITSKNVYYTDHDYQAGENLTQNGSYEFDLNLNDQYVFDRTKIIKGVAKKYKDTVYVFNSNKERSKFITVPLDKNKMKLLFWDKFAGEEFKNNESFQNYFKGLIIKANSEKSAVIPLDFSSSYTSPRIKFFYTISRSEKDVFKDVLSKELRIDLGTVTNAVYDLGPATPVVKGRVVVQGTAGSDVKLDLFSKKELNKLKSQKLLINQATISFFIDQSNIKSLDDIPKRLLLYKQIKSKDATIASEHISDAYLEPNLFGGLVELQKDKPLKYSFRITNYLNDLLHDKEKLTSLVLKVYNETADRAFFDGQTTRTKVYSHNYNPKAVTLYDGSTSNSSNKAQLNLLYSQEKTK